MNITKKHNEFLDKLARATAEDISEVKNRLTEIYPRSHSEESIAKEELIEIAIESLKTAHKALKLSIETNKRQK